MLHYPKQKGFIILIVLIFMQVFILLNWYAIESVLLLNKLSRNIVGQARQDDYAKKILLQIELSLISSIPNCVIPTIEESQLTAKPLSFWEAKSCSGIFNALKYYYVVELLSNDSCALVDQAKNLTATYFRITLLLDSNNHDARIFSQSTFIRPNASLNFCKGVKHYVQLGRQSWRELDY